MQLEVVLVPFDVDRSDTPLAGSPRELVNRGLLERLEELGATVRLRRVGVRDFDRQQTAITSLARAVGRRVARAVSRDRPVLVLSGGCLAAVGVVHGLQQARPDPAVLWLDAHGDFHTPETTLSGYWDGMSLAAITGRSLAAVYESLEFMPLAMRRIVHIGGRDLEPAEVEDFERLKLLRLPSRPTEAELHAAVERLTSARSLYLHLDLDGLDPADAPAVDRAAPDGVPLDTMVGLIHRLPVPDAVTLSGSSFAESSEEEGERQLATALTLVRAAYRLPREESDPQPADPDPDDD